MVQVLRFQTLRFNIVWVQLCDLRSFPNYRPGDYSG